MDEDESLNHTKWECKYHVVFIPKYRRKILYGELRRNLGVMIRKRPFADHFVGPIRDVAIVIPMRTKT